MTMEPRRAQLPLQEIPADVVSHQGRPCLHILGLVAQPLVLSVPDLAPLLRVELAEDFTCAEGWTVPDQHWRGVRLTDVLASAQPLPAARYVRVCAGRYAIPLALTAASAALLCDTLNGQPLAPDHGAPWRLVVPGGACFTSVKWVDRLEVTAEPGTPYRAPNANAFAERWIRTVRTACLDHLLILHERHLGRVLQDYLTYYNERRPHQGLEGRRPVPLAPGCSVGPIKQRAILGGLIHDYERIAA